MIDIPTLIQMQIQRAIGAKSQLRSPDVDAQAEHLRQALEAELGKRLDSVVDGSRRSEACQVRECWQEQPGLIDSDGAVRDLSGVVDDLTPETLGIEQLQRLKDIDPQSLPLAPAGRAHGSVRSKAGQVRLYWSELP